nr:hypothetical protein [Mycoplasmopsis bovis]
MDTYYIAVYAKDLLELKKMVLNTIANFNAMDIESELIEGLELLKFLASVSLKTLDEEEAIKYLEYQMNNNQRDSFNAKDDHIFETLTFREKVKEFFQVFKKQF